MPVGQLALDPALQSLQILRLQQFSGGWEGLSDLQVGLTIQIGRLYEAHGLRFTVEASDSYKVSKQIGVNLSAHLDDRRIRSAGKKVLIPTLMISPTVNSDQ